MKNKIILIALHLLLATTHCFSMQTGWQSWIKDLTPAITLKNCLKSIPAFIGLSGLCFSIKYGKVLFETRNFDNNALIDYYYPVAPFASNASLYSTSY